MSCSPAARLRPKLQSAPTFQKNVSMLFLITTLVPCSECLRWSADAGENRRGRKIVPDSERSGSEMIEFLVAIRKSAQSAKKKKRIDVVLITKASWIKDYRHKAVLVENKSAESVHHIRKARRRRSRRKIIYGGTTLYRKILEHSAWTIFVIDVPHYSQRVIRSNNQRLLNTFFSRDQARVAVYIPLDGQPENPRYDFLADEDNWGRRERLDR